MSLVDYASSSDDDVPQVGEDPQEERDAPKDDLKPPPPPPPSNQFQCRSSLNQKAESMSHTSAPCVEKLPDASLLLSSPAISSNLMNSSDHVSRVAAAMAENASRKRDSNGMTSSTVCCKVPKGCLTISRNVPDTIDRMLVPPQLSGRKNIVTEDIGKLFVKKHVELKPPSH